MWLGSSEAVKGAVEADLGIAILSRWTIQKELLLGTLKDITPRGFRITRDFKLIHYKKKIFPTQTEAFIQYIKNYDWKKLWKKK